MIAKTSFLPLHEPRESNRVLTEAQLRERKIQEQSKELEKVFVTYLVKALEQTLPEGVFNSSKSNLPSMLFSSVMADALVERGGFGLSAMIAQSLEEKETNLGAIKNMPVLEALEFLRTQPEEK